MSNWLTRSNKSYEATPIQKFMQSMMDDFWDQRGWNTAALTDKPLSEFSPKLNVRETDSSLQVTAELPGIDSKDVDISVDQKYLTISGEKKYEGQKDDKGSQYYECSYGSFMRRIPLPFEVNMEKVQATFEKGLLKVSLDKADHARQQTRKIPIKNG